MSSRITLRTVVGNMMQRRARARRFLAIAMGLLLAIVCQAAPKAKPLNPHQGSTFTPIDLKPVANVDPMSQEDPFGLGPEPPSRPYLWIEGEACNKHHGNFGPVSRAAASNGEVLGGGWGLKPGEWAEWYFDLPFQSNNLQLYLRVARGAGHNPVAMLQVTLDGRNVSTFSIPRTGGSGNRDRDYAAGMGRGVLGRVDMGRHVLRMTTGRAGDVINLDGFWLSDGQQDFVNRVDDRHHLPPPARLHMLVYPYGPITLRGITFDLLDPAANAGKGILLAPPNSVTIAAAGGARGQRLHVLGAGVLATTKVNLQLVYEDGETQSRTIKLGALFTRKLEIQPVAQFGRWRYGYLATVNIQNKPLRAIRFGRSKVPYVIIAATVETLPGTAKAR